MLLLIGLVIIIILPFSWDKERTGHEELRV